MTEPGEGTFHGIKGSKLRISLADGSSFQLDANPTRPPKETVAAPTIAASRASTLGRTVRQEGALRQHFRTATTEIQRSVDQAEKKRKPDGTLPKQIQGRIQREADREVRQAVGRMNKEITANIETAVKREIRAQAAHLQSLGVPPPDPATLNRMAKGVVRNTMTTPFPGTSQTTATRLGAAGARSRAHIDGFIKSDAKGKDKALDRMQRGSHDPKPGNTRLDGGSASKAVSRINRTEQARAMRDANLEMGKRTGLRFAYWRLNANHKWQGSEVCEKIAAGTGPGVEEQLRAAKVPLGSVDLTGLYSVARFPDIPHPHCMCYQTLWMPRELLNEVILDKIVEKGSQPDDMTPMSRVPDEAAGVMNAFAVRMKQPPALTGDMVKTLGIDGTARLLEAQMSRKDKADNLQSLRAFQDRATPQIQESLARARAHRDVLIGRLGSDAVLSTATKASEVAKVHQRYRAELNNAVATVSSLQALERAMSTPRGAITTASSNDSRTVLASLQNLGFNPATDFKIVEFRDNQRKRRFAAEINPAAVKRFQLQKAQEDLARVQAIKRGDFEAVQPRGIQKTIPAYAPDQGITSGRKITIRKDQLAGVKLIEEQRGVLLHFGAGLGKTPLVISSVSDLHAQGQVKAAVISTPASLRPQMVQEIMTFNANGKVVLYASEGRRRSMEKTVQDNIRKVVLERVPTIVDSDGVLRPDPKKVPKRYRETLEKEVTKRESRVEVKGLAKTAKGREAQLRADRKAGILFTVMGHDDLATSANQARKSFDYMAIDEIHQMTSQDVASGSRKASQLPKLTGGALKYRVGLTGTASKNNMGEMWDIGNWLRPGQLGDKKDFMAQFDRVTLKTDPLNESLIKAVRQRIDPFTYTRASPVKAKLHNAFAEKHPDGTVRSQAERDQFLRRVTMTPAQQRRAEKTENAFQRLKARSDKIKPAERRALEKQLDKDRKQFERDMDRLDIREWSGAPNLRDKLARMQHRGEVTTKKRADILERRTRIRDTSKVLRPENWRTNEHHKNLHTGAGSENAKVAETIRLMKGEIKGQRPIIHVERLGSVDMLTKALTAEGFKVGRFDGTMDSGAQSAAKRRFNNRELDVLIVTRAGSTGLNLQRASSSTIHFDTPWTFAEYAQREARNWRTGQTHDVSSYVLTHGDMFTDRRRLDTMRSKKDTLAALDELSKVTDRGNPLELQSAQTKPLGRSYNETVAQEGRQKADRLLKSISDELGQDLSKAKTSTVSREVPLAGLVDRGKIRKDLSTIGGK